MVRTNPPPRAVQLVALEVVQVIQDWSNSVRLIQGKELPWIESTVGRAICYSLSANGFSLIPLSCRAPPLIVAAT